MVGNHSLFVSDLPQLSNELVSKEDSTVLVNGFVENWLRKTAIVLEAESTLSSSFDIEQLVDNYRVSLLINNYQQKYVSEKLDTSVVSTDLQMEYDRSGDNFLLDKPIFEVRIAKVAAKKRGLEGFYKAWKAGTESKISEYCGKQAEYCSTLDWRTMDQIHELLPSKQFSEQKIKSNKTVQAYADGYEYFVKIEDKKDKGDKPPLSYIADKLAEVVIHRRKKALLSKLESDLYDRAMAANKIKVFKK